VVLSPQSDVDLFMNNNLLAETCPMCRTPLPTTTEESLAMVMKHVHDGKAWAQFNLANRYEVGRGVPVDWEQAHKWHLQAAEQGFAASEHALGILYQKAGPKQNLGLAVIWYEKAIAKGHAGAQCSLAMLYEKHKVPGKQARVKTLLDASAAQKNHMAECEVAYHYEHGIGGYAKNGDLAKTFYQRAALQGNDTAQYNLGGMLFAERNLPVAIFWLRVCVANTTSENHAEAKALLQQLEQMLRSACSGCPRIFATATSTSALSMRCAGCHVPYYCNRDCQRNHWTDPYNGHKMECKKVQQLKKELEKNMGVPRV
jgi:TPR repeat protein